MYILKMSPPRNKALCCNVTQILVCIGVDVVMDRSKLWIENKSNQNFANL